MKLAQTSIGRLTVAAALSLLALVVAPAGGPATPAAAAPAQQATLTVFAASSLTDAFKEIGTLFEGEKTVPVTFNFGASTQLRTQLQQGAHGGCLRLGGPGPDEQRPRGRLDQRA